jgi:hypothetical protein
MQPLPVTNGKLDCYAWPGGYPLYYLDKQNSVLCCDCANKSYADTDELDGFKPESVGVNYEDPDLYCDQCSKRIESAYADERGD